MGVKTTITIARQMGSGGSYVGQLVANQLGLKYIDREVLQLLAQQCGIEEAELAPREEKVSSFWEGIFRSLRLGPPETPYVPPPLYQISDKELFEKQTEILKSFAEQADCVIIGLAGAYVLSRHPGMINIFLYAPLGFRTKRVMEIYHTSSKEQTRSMIEDSDSMRKKYVAQMTGKEWACAENYHLCLNTSLLPLPEIAEIIIEYIKRRASRE